MSIIGLYYKEPATPRVVQYSSPGIMRLATLLLSDGGRILRVFYVLMVHFKCCSDLDKLVTRWQKENMSTLQKPPAPVLLFLPLSSYLVFILLSLYEVCMQKITPGYKFSCVVWQFLCVIHHFPLKKILNGKGSSQPWEVKEVTATLHILHTGMEIG